MTSEYVIFLGVGKVMIFLLQKFMTANFKNGFFQELIRCDLCVGFWVYLATAYLMKITILSDILPFVPVFSAILTASVSTFAMHLLSWGWKTKFEVVVI